MFQWVGRDREQGNILLTSPCCDNRGQSHKWAKSRVQSLVTWRWLHPIAFMGDIEKAFLQTSLAIIDRDVVRFIWLTGPPDVKSTRSCIMWIMPVLVRTSSSRFERTATIRNHLEKYKVTQPHAVNVLKDSLYVGDLIANPSNVEDAYAGKAGAKEIGPRTPES